MTNLENDLPAARILLVVLDRNIFIASNDETSCIPFKTIYCTKQ